MTIQEIMNAIRDMKGEFVNGNINTEELIEAMEDAGDAVEEAAEDTGDAIEEGAQEVEDEVEGNDDM